MTTCHSEGKPRLLFRPMDGSWYDIPGYEGIYQICTDGTVRRLWRTAPPTIVMPQRKKHDYGMRHQVIVWMTGPDGKRRQHLVNGLMMWTFYGTKPGKYIMVHRDGNFENNDIDNLVPMSRKEAGHKFGGNAKRRPVCRISKTGDIIGIWRSAREAGRHCFCSYQAVMDRCGGRVKDEFGMDGTTFRWYDDDYQVRKFCEVLREAAVRKPGDPVPESEWEW